MDDPIQFAFGRVGHSRLLPSRHAFAYRAWYLRLRMDVLASAPQRRGVLGIGCAAPLSWHASDHGNGDAAPEQLLAWLRNMLAEAGIQADGPIWLHAFARTFGYAFKPVSFWHCHRADGTLAAIVAEVNNTFGERHVYLLAHADARPITSGQELHAYKRFHVSPFLPVSGRYRFRFFADASRSLARIEYDDEHGHPTLVTSVSGIHRSAGVCTSLTALAGYPASALMVIGRIHWHALRLWLKRVPFHAKPQRPPLLVTRTDS